VSAPQPVLVRNTGAAPLQLLAWTATGDFLVDGGGCVAPIGPGLACTLQVRFAPSAAGDRTGELRVVSTDTSGPKTIGLSGTGVAVTAAAQGPKGDPGPAGAPGAPGAAGRDAALPSVTSTTKRKTTTCTTTLAKLASGAKVTLSRSGRALATGTVSRGGRVKLTARRALPAGTYALRAVRGSREQRVAVSVHRT
jgi:hypothetical protein